LIKLRRRDRSALQHGILWEKSQEGRIPLKGTWWVPARFFSENRNKIEISAISLEENERYMASGMRNRGHGIWRGQVVPLYSY